MADKKKEKIRVGDKEFVLQHPGVRWSMNHDYECRDRNGNIKTADFVQGILDHVVIQPADFELDDFESMQEANDFMEAVQKFL